MSDPTIASPSRYEPDRDELDKLGAFFDRFFGIS